MNTEKNKIIAEFMIKQEPTQNFCVGSIGRDVIGIFTGIQTEYFKVEELKFHSDWNWLMEVVEKIESLGYKVNIFGNTDLNKTCDHYTSIYIPNEKTFGVRKLSKIESVFNACVEFIEWHNQQKT